MVAPPPQSLSLPSDEVHVWRIGLEQPPDSHDSFQRTLTQDERARAERFHFEKHRRHFVVGRGFLRSLLARYLGTTPEDVRLSYGLHGKPALDGEHRTSRLRFNASHSGEMAVYAFVQDLEVGIDVEYIKEDFESEGIAERFFSAYEVQTLSGLPKPQRPAAFFRCWTRKEAFIKALGNGLSHPLDQFDVTLTPNEPAALLRIHHDPESVSRWSLFDLDIREGYAAAVAVEGRVHRLHRFEVESV